MPEEDIPDELFAAIPEISPSRPGIIPAPFPADPSGEFRATLEQARRDLDLAFGRELARIEDSHAFALRETEAKLQLALAQLHAAQTENERVRAEFQRKNDALRDLKRTLDSL